MAYLEINALSTILCGSFSARAYLPEMDKLELEDSGHRRTYPVLWLLHSEGGSCLDWNRTMAEACAVEYGIFIIAPDVQHTLCTNMDYGPNFEDFLATELLGICRNNLPISEDPQLNWIGGVGTGAYGAVKAAMKHPEVFTKCIAMDGIFDMKKICEQAIQGEPTHIFHHEESLKAVFGDIKTIEGSGHDVYRLAEGTEACIFYITGKKDSAYAKERQRLLKALKSPVLFRETDGEVMDLSEPQVLRHAIDWLVKG